MTLTERYLAAKRALFDAVYSDLNDRQREAVYTVNNPLLVLAGAGSGKTTVLVRRIAFLIRYGNAYWSETVPDGLTGEQVEYLAQAAKQYPPQQLKPMLDAFAEDPCPSYRVLAITFTNKAAKEIRSRIDAMFADDPARSIRSACGCCAAMPKPPGTARVFRSGTPTTAKRRIPRR